jgi:hypothetical protein
MPRHSPQPHLDPPSVERFGGFLNAAYQRIATLMALRSRGDGPVVEEMLDIDPLHLQVAQERNVGLRTLADYHNSYLVQSKGRVI